MASLFHRYCRVLRQIKSFHIEIAKKLENLRTCKRSDAVLLVDVPQLELAVCGGRDDVGRVEELDVGNGFPVSLENVRSGHLLNFFLVSFLYKIID